MRYKGENERESCVEFTANVNSSGLHCFPVVVHDLTMGCHTTRSPSSEQVCVLEYAHLTFSQSSATFRGAGMFQTSQWLNDWFTRLWKILPGRWKNDKWRWLYLSGGSHSPHHSATTGNACKGKLTTPVTMPPLIRLYPLLLGINTDSDGHSLMCNSRTSAR